MMLPLVGSTPIVNHIGHTCTVNTASLMGHRHVVKQTRDPRALSIDHALDQQEGPEHSDDY